MLLKGLEVCLLAFPCILLPLFNERFSTRGVLHAVSPRDRYVLQDISLLERALRLLPEVNPHK